MLRLGSFASHLRLSHLRLSHLRVSMHRASRIAGGTLAAFTFACASSDANKTILGVEPAVHSPSVAEITLSPGSAAQISSANLNVRFNRVTSDSRCPTKALVQCVWAGSVLVEVQAGPIIGYQYVVTRTLETVSGRDTTTVGGQVIRLLRVTPEHETMEAIPADSYRIVLRVSAAP